MHPDNPRLRELAAAGSDSVRIGIAMHDLWHAIARRPGPGSALQGLQPQQFWVLLALSGREMRMTELAELTQTTSANVTGVIDRLAERGLAERAADPADRRAVLVRLTAEGAKAVADQETEFVRSVHDALAPLTDDERAELARLLGKLDSTKG